MVLTSIWDNLVFSNISLILLAVYLITVLSTAIMVVHEKRDPAKTSTWVLLLIMLPIVGLIFYIFFGQNRRKRKFLTGKACATWSRSRTLAGRSN
jgi:cardiolipin synthase